VAVHRAQVAVGVRPLVPDGHAVLAQVRRVAVAAQEPEQLDRDRLEVHPLGGDQREVPGQVVAQPLTEEADRAGAGAVGLVHAGLQHPAQQLLVLRVDGHAVSCLSTAHT
jgi:hypothetical protein